MKKLLVIALFLLSYNSGKADWSRINTPVGAFVQTVAYSGGKLFCGTSSGLYLSTDMGSNWRYISNGINAQRISSIFKYSETLFAGTSNGIYYSTDNGETWFVISGSGDAVDFVVDGNDLYKRSYNLSHSSDYGMHWEMINGPGYTLRSLGAKNGNLFVQTTNSPVSAPVFYKSTNKGISWTPYNILLQYYCFANINDNIVAGSENGTYISYDNGLSWNFRNNFPGHAVESIAAKDNILYAGTTHGFFISRDQGNSWIDRSQGFNADLEIYRFSIWDNYALTSVTNHGLWKREISDLTGIQSISSSIPEKFSLSQNYPNPFNPSTKINFSIHSGSFVSLKIYNSIGKEVSSLVNENLNAGSYDYEFNAALLPSGIYFYTLEAGNFSETKKMLLIK